MTEEVTHKPSTLRDCFEALDIIFSPEDQERLQEMTEKEFLGTTHHFLGRHIRNEWGLWSGENALFNYFKELGLFHADDMSGIILTSYWRLKHNQPLEVQAQVDFYKKFWAEHQVKDAEDNCTD